MIRRAILSVVLGVAVTGAAWGDSLDDDLKAAKTLLAQDRTNEAAMQLDALEASARLAASANPRDAHAQYILGTAAMYSGRDDVAKRALDLAMRLDPKSVTYVMGRAQFAMYTDAPKDAVKLLLDPAAQNGGNLELQEMLGQAEQAAGQYAEAQATFAKAAAAAPKEARYQAEIAECLVSLHKEEEALAAYQKALDVNPKYTPALASIGQIQEGRKAWNKAIEAYGKVAAINPEDYRTAAKLVQLHEAAGNLKERDAAREKVLALHKAGKIEAGSFCREQFADGTSQVMVFESFELKGPMPVRYAFNVVNADGKTVEKRVSLGSYPEITAKARQEGKIKEGERMFHLDAYTTSVHETLGMYTKEPTYEDTRTMAKEYLAGRLKPLSTEAVGAATKGASLPATGPATAPGGGR